MQRRRQLFFVLITGMIITSIVYGEIPDETPQAPPNTILGQMQKKTKAADKVFKDMDYKKDGDKEAFFEGDEDQKNFKIKSDSALMSNGKN